MREGGKLISLGLRLKNLNKNKEQKQRKKGGVFHCPNFILTSDDVSILISLPSFLFFLFFFFYYFLSFLPYSFFFLFLKISSHFQFFFPFRFSSPPVLNHFVSSLMLEP